jgi:hypothetical protein
MLGAVVRIDETGTWIDQSVVPVAKDFLSDCLSVCLSVCRWIDCLLLISYYYLSRLLSSFLPSFLPASRQRCIYGESKYMNFDRT